MCSDLGGVGWTGAGGGFERGGYSIVDLDAILILMTLAMQMIA